MKTVLIVEDDSQTYQLIANVLKRDGYHVLRAQDGIEGLAAARDQSPHLVLLDMRLPRLDGWEVTQAMRSDAQLRTIPIVALTVQVDPLDEERALAAGVDGYVAKPFDIKYLRNYIRRFLEQG